MPDERLLTKTISSRTRSIIFKIATGITIIGMLAGGVSQLFRAEYQVNFFEQLGYPLYLMSIIGIGKILGGITLGIPGIPPLFKIGAYSGLFFVTSSAVISHIVEGVPVDAISPFVVAVIAITSCLLNPDVKFALQKVETNTEL